MGIWQSFRNFIRRNINKMTTTSLTSILDHPKIAVSQTEYNRIQSNLKFYESSFDDVQYTNTDGELKKRKYNHLPLAKTAVKKIASLVYNEQAEITVANEKCNAFIQNILYNDKFNKNFERYLESGLALGGLAMRPYFDGETIKIAFIQAPVFLPLENNTQDVSSAVIVSKITKTQGQANIYYTLIEFHEWQDKKYVITNELYRSNNANSVGTKVSLTEIFDNLEEVVTINNLSRPLFTYFKPPGMNNKDINSPLGLSIYDNAKSTIDFINRTYDEFLWEIKMGQRRVAVPDDMTKIQTNKITGQLEHRRRFDPEQNVYMTFNTGNMDNNPIVDLTTPIRADDYIKSINKGLALFEMQIGVSAGMFSFDGKTMKTATEIVSENSDTYQMRNSIVSLVEYSIKELIVSICELGKAMSIYFGEIPKLEDISVNLDDGIFTDKNVELEYWSKALASGLVSKKFAIQKVLGITEEEAQKMLNEITEDETPDLEDEDKTIYGA